MPQERKKLFKVKLTFLHLFSFVIAIIGSSFPALNATPLPPPANQALVRLFSRPAL
jgi:hypothetical protein